MTARRTRRARQLELPARTWGGRRPGAGRKPRPGRRRVPHTRRPATLPRHPAHVTWRLRDGLPSLRQPRPFAAFRRAVRAAQDRFGMRVVHFGVMSNHLHMLVEHMGKRSLSRGMQGLGVRLAKAFNRTWRRKGKVFADRYHSRPLRTPLETRRGLSYALNNARRHAAQRGRSLPRGWLDPYSSSASFDGWTRRPRVATRTATVTVAPRTWLLREGWRRHGLIEPSEVPGGRRPLGPGAPPRAAALRPRGRGPPGR